MVPPHDAAGTLILNSCAVLLRIGRVNRYCQESSGSVVVSIVPALVLFGMSNHRAVGTSLMVIALVSVSESPATVGWPCRSR
jgi:hypothetical protein